MLLILLIATGGGGGPARAAEELVTDGALGPFLGAARFDELTLFDEERFPNVIVGRDGTVVATWGSERIRVRRSEDGGDSWGPEIDVGEGIHGGGALVDERSGAMLMFVHPEHPPRDGSTAPRTVYRSEDQGASWAECEATFREDANGYVPSLHMSEHGTTLRRGPHAGRLIRPARVYQPSPDRYATAIYSDDGGQTWQSSGPFPLQGTGEGALLERSDGQLIYSARRSFFPDDEPFQAGRVFARSDDGGTTWGDPFSSTEVPDGPRYRGEERRGANYNAHFGMMAGFARLPVRDRDILISSNADHDGHERVRLTVWASFDGGATWPVKRLVHEAESAYSSLAAGRPGTPSEGWIYLLYEYGDESSQYVGGKLARLNLSWILDGELTGDGTLPAWLDEYGSEAFLQPPKVITDPGPSHGGASRRFQGIPSLARSEGGRLWATWYGGPTPGEDRNNYVILASSGDDGQTWSRKQVIVDPDGEGPVRAFDPQVWADPDGRMWAFWAQAVGHGASVGGVWAMVSDNPDDEDAEWSEPRRLTDGVMMGKPLVLSSGEWCLPASTWRETDRSARMVVSPDRGRTWAVRGGCNVPKDVRSFDEHMIVERGDGSLWMLARTTYGIGESRSTDRGRTWSELAPSGIAHPSARFFLRRLSSGNLLLVKHGPIDESTGRSHLMAFLSEDDGSTWTGGLLLDERDGVSYPDGVEGDDGTVFVIYDYSRREEREILMARFKEEDVRGQDSESPSLGLRILVDKASSASPED
ncbi:sialidase family protein [Tautonia sp. JC769]|uniref:sialidase family protein n=1 Tax=Tautonia sp. JC769 TaxID=3232135 RepID=UPI003459A232